MKKISKKLLLNLELDFKLRYLCTRFRRSTDKQRFRKKSKKNQQSVARIKKVITFAPFFARNAVSMQKRGSEKN